MKSHIGKIFYTLLNDFVASSQHALVIQRLTTVNWELEAETIYCSVCTYWEKISNAGTPAKFLIATWRNSDNQFVDFDCIENDTFPKRNARKHAQREPLISFEKLLNQTLKLANKDLFDEDLFEEGIKKFLCELSRDVIIASLASDNFARIKKKNSYEVRFAYDYNDSGDILHVGNGNTKKQQAQNDYIASWDTLTKETLRAKSLLKHFEAMGVSKPLASTLKLFCEQVTAVSIVTGKLRLTIPSGSNGTLIHIDFNPPYQDDFDASVPKSFRKFYNVHNGLSYSHSDSLNSSFIITGIGDLGGIEEPGGWDSEAVHQGNNRDVLEQLEQQDEDTDSIICFGEFDGRQNWYVLHPFKKNKAREPVIVSFYHGSCSLSDAHSKLTCADFILTELVRLILGK